MNCSTNMHLQAPVEALSKLEEQPFPIHSSSLTFTRVQTFFFQIQSLTNVSCQPFAGGRGYPCFKKMKHLNDISRPTSVLPYHKPKIVEVIIKLCRLHGGEAHSLYSEQTLKLSQGMYITEQQRRDVTLSIMIMNTYSRTFLAYL